MSSFAHIGDLTLHHTQSGPAGGPVLVLIHGLATDLRIWDDVLKHLPQGVRVIRYDLRGHGTSDVPKPPYAMGALVRDAEGLLDHLDARACVCAGLGLGGLVVQGLAVKRLDLVRGLVLAGTAAKWGLPDRWRAQAQTAQSGGMEAVADHILSRWYPPHALNGEAATARRARLLQVNPDGYAEGCTAIAGTDFYTPTSGLRLPTLALVGSDDRATPPDLVRETVGLIPGSTFRLIRRAGHLACVDQPQVFGEAVAEFLRDIGHV